MLYKHAVFSLIVVAILLAGIQTASGQASTVVKWKVQKNSTLRVEGKTNVNSFTFHINEYTKSDTLICLNGLSRPAILKGQIEVDVLNFDCHSSMLTKGLRKTLKADQYPTMVIRFLSLQSTPLLQYKTELVKGVIEVELAGVVKRFELGFSFAKTSAGKIQLDGGRNFCFSDFGLAPPKKFGGLIKVKDEFDVQFQLMLSVL